MTAEEMFQKLGYKKSDWYKDVFSYTKKKGDEEDVTIGFDCNDKTFCVDYYCHSETLVYDISIQEFKAIQKQIEELGW